MVPELKVAHPEGVTGHFGLSRPIPTEPQRRLHPPTHLPPNYVRVGIETVLTPLSYLPLGVWYSDL